MPDDTFENAENDMLGLGPMSLQIEPDRRASIRLALDSLPRPLILSEDYEAVLVLVTNKINQTIPNVLQHVDAYTVNHALCDKFDEYRQRRASLTNERDAALNRRASAKLDSRIRSASELRRRRQGIDATPGT